MPIILMPKGPDKQMNICFDTPVEPFTLYTTLQPAKWSDSQKDWIIVLLGYSLGKITFIDMQTCPATITDQLIGIHRYSAHNSLGVRARIRNKLMNGLMIRILNIFHHSLYVLSRPSPHQTAQILTCFLRDVFAVGDEKGRKGLHESQEMFRHARQTGWLWGTRESFLFEVTCLGPHASIRFPVEFVPPYINSTERSSSYREIVEIEQIK